MKSLRVWLSGIALGATMIFSAPSAQAQVPDGFTYQGILVDNGVPVSGAVTLDISLSDNSGHVLYSETFQNVIVSDGIFNMVLRNFPTTTMDFNEQYLMEVTVTNSNGTTSLPPTELWSAPYAINSGTVNGISASPVPIAGDLFPVPIGSGYPGSTKMDPGFLPIIPNALLQTPDIQTINGVGPDIGNNFEISGDAGITVTQGTHGITINGSNTVGSTSTSATQFIVLNSETSGNDALIVGGGIGANNPTGAADGTGLTSGSPQTYWADQVSVPSATGASILIYNTLISSKSTIVITPVESSASAIEIAITAQSAGTFTVSSTSTMGTSGGGTVTALNYLVINH
jgi:hypothetical protein